MASSTVYFNKIRITKNDTVSIICTSAPIESKSTEIQGLSVSARNQAPVTFGVLSLIDDATGKSLHKDHALAKAYASKFKKNMPMPGLSFTDKPILKKDSQEETGLFWVDVV